jgi:UDP-glucose 4-epimerase
MREAHTYELPIELLENASTIIDLAEVVADYERTLERIIDWQPNSEVADFAREALEWNERRLDS